MLNVASPIRKRKVLAEVSLLNNSFNWKERTQVPRATSVESSVLSPLTPALCPAGTREAGTAVNHPPGAGPPRLPAAEAQPCGGARLRPRAPHIQPACRRLAAPRTHLARSYAGPKGCGGRGRGGAAGAGAGPRAARARPRGSARRRAGRASLCSLCRRWGRWSRGPRARSSPRSRPKRPRAAGRAGFGS